MPWRENRSPYRVWISEVMLQQTRVETVIPYFRRFLRRFPTVEKLAAADSQAVLKCWEGLGYYSRARNLQRAARVIVREQGGVFPSTEAGWRVLPGVGEYTAAAVASLACGEDAVVFDGNVARVAARMLAFGGRPKSPAGRRRLHGVLLKLLPPGRSRDFNESWMELGALVCTPRRPACGACPLNRACRAYLAGEPERYPLPARRNVLPHKVVGAGVVRDGRGRILIAQRRDGAMLGGLWEFPGGSLEPGETLPACIRRELREELGIDVVVGECLAKVRHAYSHFRIELHAHWARIRAGRPRALECAAVAWVRPEEFDRRPFSKADLQVIAAIRNHRAR